MAASWTMLGKRADGRSARNGLRRIATAAMMIASAIRRLSSAAMPGGIAAASSGTRMAPASARATPPRSRGEAELAARDPVAGRERQREGDDADGRRRHEDHASLPSFRNASMSARVRLTLTRPGFGPPLASTSGSSPRAPPEATVWPDFFSPPPRLLARLPRPKPFFLGFSSAGAASFFASLSASSVFLALLELPDARPDDARRDRRDLRLRHRLVADELLVARFERHRAGALLLLLRGELVQPLLHRRVRGEQAALLAGVLVAIGQPLQERAQPVRLIAGLGGEAEAVLIGLQLLAAPEALQRDVGDLTDERARDAVALAARRGRRVDEAGLRQRLDGVVLDDVDQLVAEHAGQLRLVGDQRQAALRDVDVAAGRGEGVDGVGVEHDEAPRVVGLLADAGQDGADERHVAVHGLVLHHAELLADVGADLGAELLLLGFRVDGVVGLLGHRQPLADAAELRRRRRGQHAAAGQRQQEPNRQTLHLLAYTSRTVLSARRGSGTSPRPVRPARSGCPPPAPRKYPPARSCP